VANFLGDPVSHLVNEEGEEPSHHSRNDRAEGLVFHLLGLSSPCGGGRGAPSHPRGTSGPHGQRMTYSRPRPLVLTFSVARGADVCGIKCEVGPGLRSELSSSLVAAETARERSPSSR